LYISLPLGDVYSLTYILPLGLSEIHILSDIRLISLVTHQSCIWISLPLDMGGRESLNIIGHKKTYIHKNTQ